MNRLLILVALLLLPLAGWAQDGSYQATQQPKQGVIAKKPEVGAAEKLRPRGTGVVYAISAKGLQVLSPLAPASAGGGPKVLTAGQALEKHQGSAVEDPKPYGGITLVGVEF